MPVIELYTLDLLSFSLYFCKYTKRIKLMGLFINILVVKKMFLVILFCFVSVICSAPVIDFRLKLTKFNLISAEVKREYHESEFTRFINDLGYRESANNWKSVNFIGCFGEWQFAESTIHYLGFKQVTLKKFRKDPNVFPRELQVKALESLIKVNLFLLRDYEHYIGDTIKGVIVTKSGLIAASHLGGARSVKLFLASDGRLNKKDALGTSVGNYMKKFSFYDLD